LDEGRSNFKADRHHDFMPDRFFVESPVAGDRANLSGPEGHHLAHVLRARLGDVVTLFDGSGDEFPARIEKIGRSTAELVILERRQVNREMATALSLAVALPKGERQRWLVEKAVELGVTRLVPLITKRGVVQPAQSAMDRLRRAVIEASKQCGRNRLMEIAEPRQWSELAGADAEATRLMAHPGGISLREAVAPIADAAQRIVAAIGPEGGFTDEEVNQGIAASWRLVDLGPRILRIETAAVAIAACVEQLHNSRR
jgi:16S rRNA (uracil1498-N3)-methyltransferase